MSVGKKWLDALGETELDVVSARDALRIKGWLDTGNYALNWAVSGRLLRGYPLGHSVEIFGESGTGKSYLATRALGMVQSQGGVALLDDVEGAYNMEWIENLGVDPDALALKSSRTVKEHLEVAKSFIAAYSNLELSAPAVLVSDSLAALSTEHELEVGLDKRDMTKAAELKSFFRQIGGEIVNRPVLYLATNHTIANIGGWGSSRTTPGGGGPKFHSTVRVDLRTPSKIKEGKNYTGVVVRAVVAKNRVTAPWKEVRLAIPFYRPVARGSGLIHLLLELGILETSGHYLTVAGEKTDIKAYKTKKRFLDQDRSAEELLARYPSLLERVDEILAERESEDDADPRKGAKLVGLEEGEEGEEGDEE